MKKRVLLTITGTQMYDDNNDKIELTTVGTLEERNDWYVVKYKEEQEPPQKAIDVTVKIAKDDKTVEILRCGVANSCLIIEKSKRNLCHYGTFYGDILMGIHGKTIQSDVQEDCGRFEFGYDVDINGALTSRNKLVMDYKNN